MTSAQELAVLPDSGLRAPDGRRFPWGPIQSTHRYGRYEVVEFLRDCRNMHPDDSGHSEHGTRSFHPFIDGRDTNRSYGSLEAAIVGAIAIAFEGINTRADGYFARMVGFEP